MKEKDENLLFLGIFNAISVIPVLILATIVAFAVFMFTGMKLKVLTVILFLFVIFLSPISCIKGIVKGIRSWKTENSRIGAAACTILSMIGILLFVVVMSYFWWRSAIS